MARSGFRSLSEVERALRFQRQDLVDLLLEVRSIVARVAPQATERIDRTGVTLYDAEKGGTISGGICFIDIHDERVRVAFGLGAFLDDPKSLLTGDNLYKRHLEFTSFEDAPWAEIEDLIRASAALDPSKLNPGKG